MEKYNIRVVYIFSHQSYFHECYNPTLIFPVPETSMFKRTNSLPLPIANVPTDLCNI